MKSIRVKQCKQNNPELEEEIKRLKKQLEDCQTSYIESDQTIKDSINAIDSTVNGTGCGSIFGAISSCFGLPSFGNTDIKFNISKDYLETPSFDEKNKILTLPNYVLNFKKINSDLCECLTKTLETISETERSIILSGISILNDISSHIEGVGQLIVSCEAIKETIDDILESNNKNNTYLEELIIRQNRLINLGRTNISYQQSIYSQLEYMKPIYDLLYSINQKLFIQNE